MAKKTKRQRRYIDMSSRSCMIISQATRRERETAYQKALREFIPTVIVVEPYQSNRKEPNKAAIVSDYSDDLALP